MIEKKFIIILTISFFLHLFLFILVPDTLLSLSSSEIPIYVDEVSYSEDNSKQMVDQQSFNHQVPLHTSYSSQHNNKAVEEQKGKLGQSIRPTFVGTNDNNLNDSDFSELLSQQLPSYTGRIDFLQNIEKEGEQNILNTKKMWFYGFYSRVKNQLHWHWIQEIKTEITPSLLKGQKQKPPFTTRLEAYIDNKGRLIAISIKKKSGLDILDTVAVTTIKRAHPFSNPPKELISADGSIRLDYAFTLTNQKTF